MEGKPKIQQLKREYNYYHQLHKPPKMMRKNKDTKLKVRFKSGESTMLLCRNMTSAAATGLTLMIASYISKHKSKLEGQFIFTK